MLTSCGVIAYPLTASIFFLFSRALNLDERDAMVAELMEQYNEIKASLRQWGLGVDASIES